MNRVKSDKVQVQQMQRTREGGRLWVFLPTGPQVDVEVCAFSCSGGCFFCIGGAKQEVLKN